MGKYKSECSIFAALLGNNRDRINNQGSGTLQN
jgi:hypothetical protein